MISIFDIFKVGIGPSSSHTMAPMTAAREFLLGLQNRQLLDSVKKLEVELYGSLALTGKGHRTDSAILLGLMGETADEIDVNAIPGMLQKNQLDRKLSLLGVHEIAFDSFKDLIFNIETNPYDFSSVMRFAAFNEAQKLLFQDVYFSLGGGFIVRAEEYLHPGSDSADRPEVLARYPFDNAKELLDIGKNTGLPIHQIVLTNEEVWQPKHETLKKLDQLWSVMSASIDAGCARQGLLPGAIAFPRRAPDLYKELLATSDNAIKTDPLLALDWINLFALAVNEENASGGRIVTAPTFGAAGIIPAVGQFYLQFVEGANRQGIHRLLLTAYAIAVLFKKNASFAASEVGCQGEIGVACSMAAAGYVAAIGGTNAQIELAAETGMEHNLGLTCDPIGGYVQIPCIERNALGAVKAIDAARLAMRSDGAHYVSLDAVIKTMWETGKDMQEKYKDTGKGGLAANVPLC